MRNRAIVLAVLAWSTAGGLVACGSSSGGGTVVTGDAGGETPEAGTGGDAGGGEAGATIHAEAGAGEGGAEASTDAGAPQRLLLSLDTFTGAATCQLAAFDLASRSVAGRLTYPCAGSGTSYVGPTAPWLLEEGTDVVARLDAERPWTIDSSWSVAENGADAAWPYSDPQAVVVGAGTKAYVLPYLANQIAVIDTSSDADGGRPTSFIDLSSELQPGGDGALEMTAGFYVESAQRLYVLLGNINQDQTNDPLQCAGNAAPALVAIDTTTDTLVTLGGLHVQGHGIALQGRNPTLGPGAMAYDPVNDRALVLESGCPYPPNADGGAPPPVDAAVEQVSLSTGATQILLDLSAQPSPAQLVYVGAHQAFVQVGYGPYTTYAWDPTTTSLGSAVPNAPDAFAWDGAGNLVGASATYDDAGAVAGYDVVSVRASDGTVTTLASNPFTLSLSGGYLDGAQLWPAP